MQLDCRILKLITQVSVDNGKLNINITPSGWFHSKRVKFNYGDYHYDLAIVIGVPQRAKIDRVLAEIPSSSTRCRWLISTFIGS